MMLPDAQAAVRSLGPYQLGLLLGEGGMGEVFKAFDDRLGRWVAMKRVRQEAGERHRERFRHEARTLAMLGHPGIVQIFDWLTDDDGDWIVMELVDGPTLAELRRSGPLVPSLVLDYGRQIASALAAAHGIGIIHRDLKSENVMVLPSGHIKVLDFGLARRSPSAPAPSDAGPARALPEDPAWTLGSGHGRIVGTPRAMSPEQALGRQVDARSDLFSLGVLLYELLTARSPFSGRDLSETLSRVVRHYPPTASRLNPAVPQPLSQLVDQLLEKDPAQRPGRAAELEKILESLGSSRIPSYAEALPSPLSSPDEANLDATTLGGAPSLSAPPNRPHDSVVVTTLLVSALVGTTDLMERLGDRGAASVFRQHDRLTRDLVREHAGREIDKTDGFLLLFDRPRDAVAFAIAYHRAARELDLKARVGIHLGEVVLHRNSEDDVRRGAKPVEVEGLAKLVAARLMALAISGQTLLTRTAYEVAQRSSAEKRNAEPQWQWPCHGRYRFHGLADEVEVFEVGSPGEAPLVRPTGSAKVRRVEARADVPPRIVGPSGLRQRPVTLRTWPPPELPEQPYPVLLPYDHPNLLAGREAEISRLRRMLAMQVPILGLSAPSGMGKSSLLVGGLVPALRAAGTPVALVRHPAEVGLASRLIDDLLEGSELPADHAPRIFVDRLLEVERLAGAPPILVLDQFEDVLDPRSEPARRLLGLLMASSLARRPGLSSAPCRWLIAYRRELYGRLRAWLGDVLREARRAGEQDAGSLPHDLSGPERFHRMALTPLATPPQGSEAPLEASAQVFLAAIEAPFSKALDGDDTAPGSSFPQRFRPGHAARLARAFAEARRAQPEAPLTPDLQVVLAHLLSQAGEDGMLAVPEDVGTLIGEALNEHLRRALQGIFPADGARSSERRARALLALRELATSSGRREEGSSTEQLTRAIGDGGEDVLQRLSKPLTRLVWVRETPKGLRWTLSHDRLAEAIVRLVDEEGRRGRLELDTELLALHRFVNLRTALFCSGQGEASTRVSRRRFRRIRESSEALLWDDERRSWFAACVDRRRSDRLRLAALGSLALVILALTSVLAWGWAERMAAHQSLLDQVAGAEPEEAFRALHALTAKARVDDSELLALLRQRDATMDILEWGLGGLEEPERSETVLRIVNLALPWVHETPEDPVLIANLSWALDFSAGRDPSRAEEAQSLRARVLAPLRGRHSPPPLAEADDPGWISIPPGRFLMGTAEGEKGRDDERPQHEVAVLGFRLMRHEVTVNEYRRLVPDHQPDADGNLPAAYVSWYAAYTYAAWLGGRLPYEAEWEYAARAGCAFAYCDRDGAEVPLEAIAWMFTNAKSTTGEPGPRPVMGLEPNPWGLYDMLGNLWEWTAEAYAAYPEDPRTPWVQETGSGRRVNRGGSFRNVERRTRTADRVRYDPGFSNVNLGFRVALPDPPEPSSSPTVSIR